jgi:hypothetical protein
LSNGFVHDIEKMYQFYAAENDIDLQYCDKVKHASLFAIGTGCVRF